MFANRKSMFLIVLSIFALALVSLSVAAFRNFAANSSTAVNHNTALAQRQDEWTAGVTSEQAYLDQRYSEWTAGQTAIADRSYDSIEVVRIDRMSTYLTADHSYDSIENLRAQRSLQ